MAKIARKREKIMAKKVMGSGRYSVKTYEAAIDGGNRIRTSRGKASQPRKMHRDDLLRYVVKQNSVDMAERTISDPRNLVPYRGASYGTIVSALLSRLPSSAKDIVGIFSQDFNRVTWNGTANSEIDAIVATPWIWSSKLFDLACKKNPDLAKTLKSRKSTRPGVENHIRDPFLKFCKNVEVLQRTGGVTPYALPLMRCEYAIDSKWGTRNGAPEIQFRLVIGRSVPQKESKRTLKVV
jgi:hypothetical protein